MDLICTPTPDCSQATDVLSRVVVVSALADAPLSPEVSGTVVVLQSDNDGTFTELRRLTTGGFPTRAWLRDLDGGGTTQLDLVVLDNNNFRVAIYRDSGAGLPAAPTQTFTFASSVAHGEVVDLTGDGRADVVLTVPGRSELIALVNDSAGTFNEVRTTATTGLSRFVVGDLNPATAVPDLAILNVTNSRVELWMGTGTGTFTQSAFTDVTPAVRDIAGAANLLGTGGFGLAVASDYAADEDFGALHIIGINSAGVLVSNQLFVTRNFTNQVFVLDGPGTSAPFEILATHSNDVHVSRWSGGNPTPTTLETTRGAIDVASGNITGDGVPDFVTAEAQFRVLGVFVGNGAGGYSRTQIAFTTRVTSPRLVNVNNAGQLDLLFLQPNADKLGVLLNLNP
jgi:hypothetical protein